MDEDLLKAINVVKILEKNEIEEKNTFQIIEISKFKLSKDGVILLKTNSIMRETDINEVEKVLSEKTGFKVVIINGRYEVKAIIDKE